MQFLNWCYSDEGAITFGYGREGETYYIDEEGNPQWLPEILEKYANAEDAYYQASSDMGVNNGYFCPAWIEPHHRGVPHVRQSRRDHRAVYL